MTAPFDLKQIPTATIGVMSRVPARASPRMALAAAVLATAMFVAWEGSLAATGMQPEPLPGELDLWLENYRRIGPDSVVFVGSSRTQQGISPAVVAQTLGIPHWRVINLGISAGPGLPMLEHFAAREDFKGTLVVEILPTHDFGGEPSAMQEACLAQLARVQPFADGDLAAHRLWHSLRTARDDGSPLAVLRATIWRARGEELRENKIPQKLHPDRWREILIPEPDAAKRKADAEDIAKTFKVWGRGPKLWQFLRLLERFETAVAKVEKRGGIVILVHMPTDFAVKGAEDRFSPEMRPFGYRFRNREPSLNRWYDFNEFTETSFHSPALWAVQTFDGSHLRGEDAKVFSRHVGELLKERMQKKDAR